MFTLSIQKLYIYYTYNTYNIYNIIYIIIEYLHFSGDLKLLKLFSLFSILLLQLIIFYVILYLFQTKVYLFPRKCFPLFCSFWINQLYFLTELIIILNSWHIIIITCGCVKDLIPHTYFYIYSFFLIFSS